jgi:2-polyprenyl-6-hydroxyphenyl methylase/3-demethylubiquinone-9 3-methyltransferase
MSSQHTEELKRGERFSFGENWLSFLSVLNEDRIQQAERSLQKMLEMENLEGKTFLDIGQGSGLFSLAARRLGARVHSFDNDLQSVACAKELKDRYFPDDQDWHVEQGSVLDVVYLKSLDKSDIVYSWGVLHHTGAMWQALENIGSLVTKGGWLYIAIYNDQGGWSRRWKVLKRTYNNLPKILKPLFAFLVMGPREIKFFALASLYGKPWVYFNNIINYTEHSTRGMSYWYDLIDWIGGYPFEVAKPEEIFNLYKHRSFTLLQLRTCAGSLGCNEFVFKKNL